MDKNKLFCKSVKQIKHSDSFISFLSGIHLLLPFLKTFSMEIQL